TPLRQPPSGSSWSALSAAAGLSLAEARQPVRASGVQIPGSVCRSALLPGGTAGPAGGETGGRNAPFRARSVTSNAAASGTSSSQRGRLRRVSPAGSAGPAGALSGTVGATTGTGPRQAASALATSTGVS